MEISISKLRSGIGTGHVITSPPKRTWRPKSTAHHGVASSSAACHPLGDPISNTDPGKLLGWWLDAVTSLGKYKVWSSSEMSENQTLPLPPSPAAITSSTAPTTVGAPPPAGPHANGKSRSRIRAPAHSLGS